MNLKLNKRKKYKNPSKSKIIQFLRDLISIPSYSGDEELIAQRILLEMKKIGFEEAYLDSLGNVIGRIGNFAGPKLLYDVPMDIYKISTSEKWHYNPYKGDIDGGFIYGCGAANSKASIASMLYGIKELIENQVELKGTLYFSATVMGQCCEGYAVSTICEHLKPDAVLLGKPTDLHISRGQRGKVKLEIVTQGKSHHASAPESGLNPIYLICQAGLQLEQYANELKYDPILGNASLTVTNINTPNTAYSNLIPDQCKIHIDRRLILGENLDTVFSEIQSLLIKNQIKAKISVVDFQNKTYTGQFCSKKMYFPTWLMPENHRLIRLMKDVLRENLDFQPKIICWKCSSNGVATRGEHGIPTLGFGPGEEHNCHKPDEKVSVVDVIHASQIYAKFATAFFDRIPDALKAQ